MSKAKKYNLIVILLCFLFFWVYSYLVLATYLPEWSNWHHLIFNWPDESANYFFARVFARSGSFSQMENLNLLSDNLLHARSVNVLPDGSLVPIGFLPALVIFGLSLKILGEFGGLFLTSFLASLTVYGVYRLVFYVFKKIDLALLVVLLMLPLAPWLYFANMVMLYGIVFIFLVVFGWLAIINSFIYSYKKDFWWILGSAVLTLAVFVRPTEVVWLGVLALVVIYWHWGQFDFKRVLSGLIVFLAAGIIFLSLNKAVYGSYFSSGYLNLETGGLPTDFNKHSYLSLLFAPFGFDLKLILFNFYKYFIRVVPLHFILACLGFGWMFFKSRVEPVWKSYLAISSLIFIIILIYYGSWQNPDPLVRELNTISISHVRYFLPLYILTLPFASFVIIQLCRYLGKSGRILYWIFVIALGISSFKTAFLSHNDGLLATRDSLFGYYQQFAKVQEIAPQNSVIISERSDKVFWPYYKVVVPQGDLPLFSRIATFIDKTPVYYYTDLSDRDLTEVKTKAESTGLYFGEPSIINNNFKLYKIEKLK